MIDKMKTVRPSHLILLILSKKLAQGDTDLSLPVNLYPTASHSAHRT